MHEYLSFYDKLWPLEATVRIYSTRSIKAFLHSVSTFNSVLHLSHEKDASIYYVKHLGIWLVTIWRDKDFWNVFFALLKIYFKQTYGTNTWKYMCARLGEKLKNGTMWFNTSRMAIHRCDGPRVIITWTSPSHYTCSHFTVSKQLTDWHNMET